MAVIRAAVPEVTPRANFVPIWAAYSFSNWRTLDGRRRPAEGILPVDDFEELAFLDLVVELGPEVPGAEAVLAHGRPAVQGELFGVRSGGAGGSPRGCREHRGGARGAEGL